MLERDIVAACIKRVGQLGGRAVKVHASQMGNGGEPDISGCLAGRCLKIEVKRPGGVATPRQAAVLRKWLAVGAVAGVVTSVDELDVLLGEAGLI